jgi:hypothetical protein
MKRPPRPWIVVFIAVVGILVACGSRADEPMSEYHAQLQAALGVAEAGPLPEYRLFLDLDTADRRVVGRQQVIVPNRTADDLNEVVFRLYPNLPQYAGQMSVGPVWVDGQRSTSEVRANNTSLVVPLPEPLRPEASTTISMTFSIRIPEPAREYVLFGYSQGIWSLPDAYPLLAVHEGSLHTATSGPTWLEDLAPAHGDAVFSDAALYDVTLTLPPTLTLASTGSVVTGTETLHGKQTYHIVGGPFREFAWLASTDYSVVKTTAHGVTVYSYFLPGDEAAGQAALNTAAAALRVYADAFGPYPFPKMVVAEAPLNFYGMEYPGLNLIGIALYRSLRHDMEMRVAHEIAHQWWYSQVGNDPINIPWLDEGLAEYSTATYYAQVYGQARANTLINQRWLIPYQASVENGLDAAVNQPAAAFGNEYEVIVYAKAALFFDALRREVGDETYQAIVRQYLEQFRWKIATPDGFLRVAEAVSGQELDSLYNRWIFGQQ